MTKTAIVIGATGLVGLQLVTQLLASEQWHKVVVFVRSSLNVSDEKLLEHVVDFADMPQWQADIKGDSLFICLGTTLSQAGSKTAMRKIDLELPLAFATLAKGNGVNDCLLISSYLANAHSLSHYLRLKGELENQLAQLGFQRFIAFRPGPLLGKRKQPRFSEQVVAAMQPIFRAPYSPLRAWRGISADQLAHTMSVYALLDDNIAKQVVQGESLFQH
ncbi:NAD(P)H-binding protein [Agarivorans sp. DSG3-1]|uniref:NAD(P)H-binding protein n=1 Tax=Agarivorans sp. DSG3-1 TaxID=3342249 RepID=UPI00398E38A2